MAEAQEGSPAPSAPGLLAVVRPWALLLVALLLLPQLFRFEVARFGSADSRDLYQYWAVGAARRLGATESPYLSPRAYAAVLAAGQGDEGSPRLQKARTIRRRPNLNQTPLVYAVGAALPARFEDAAATWYAVQTAALLAAFALLAFAWGGDWGLAALVWIVTVRFYGPLHWDHVVGNLNTLQLAGLALPLALTTRMPERVGPAAFALLALGADLLLKPTLAPAVLGLALTVAVRLGSADRVRRAAALAAAGLVVTGAVPCLYLRDPAAWIHWTAAVGAGGVPGANVSPPFRLAFAFGGSRALWAGLILLALVLTLAAAIVGPPSQEPRRALLRVARCPSTLAALGVLAMLACSPLVWPHYHVLLFVPFFAVLHGSRPRALGIAAVAASCLVATRGLQAPLLPFPISSSALRWLVTLVWLPPWLALLPHVRALAEGTADQGAAPVQQAAEVEPSPLLTRSPA